MPEVTSHPLSVDAIDRFQADRKHWVVRLGRPGLVLLGIGTVVALFQGPMPLRLATVMVGFVMMVAFAAKLKCPACGKSPIGRQTSWNPDTCYTCGIRLKH